MSLENLEGINSKTRAILIKNGWTLDKLATASPAKLSVIPGIGSKTAVAIIDASRAIINDELLQESMEPEYNPLPPEPTQQSVRVRRIYRGNV